MRLSIFLRQAGIFTYPPALYHDISKWVDSILAGHWLAQAITQQAKWPSRSVSFTTNECKEWIDGNLQEIRLNIETWKNKEKISSSYYRMEYNVSAPVTGGLHVGVIVLSTYDYDTDLKERKFGLAFLPGKTEDQWDYSYFDKHCERVNGARELTPEQAIKATHSVAAKAKAAVEAWAQKHRMESTSSEVRMVDWKALETECRKYTTRAKFYKSKTTEEFTVNLAGWEYLQGEIKIKDDDSKHDATYLKHNTDQIKKLLSAIKRLREGEESEVFLFTDIKWNAHIVTLRAVKATEREGADEVKYQPTINGKKLNFGLVPSYIETYFTDQYIKPWLEKKPVEYKSVDEYLANSRLNKIKVVVSFAGHKKRAGQWSMSDKTLELDVYKFPISLNGFRDALANAHETIKHELQHLGQDYLARIKGLKEDAGLPSRSIRQTGVSTYGVPISTKGKGKGKPKQIEHEMRDVEFYTDLRDLVDRFERLVKLTDPKQRRDLFDRFVGTFSPAENKYFQSWKTKNPAKWKKAVAEFEKELAQRGITIPGRDHVYGSTTR